MVNLNLKHNKNNHKKEGKQYFRKHHSTKLVSFCSVIGLELFLAKAETD